MINSLRKLRRKKIKNSQYLKYAFGEIILVVIGILIALSINNWNETRKDNKTEKSILESLALEFTANRDELQKIMKLHQESTQHSYKLIGYFNQDISDIPIDSLELFLLTSSETDSFDPRKGKLNSIISSGQINLIRNQELTILLASFEDMVNDTKEELMAILDLTDVIISESRSFLNWGKINSLRYIGPSNDSFESDYDKLLANREIYNTYSSLNAWREAMNAEEEIQLRSINRILELIDIELKE